MAKIDRLLEHIKKLDIGTKLSVRTLAKEQSVSDATAYKAIKIMEEEGYLETLPRTGTLRIESEKEKKIESITYKEILRIVDGTLLGGEEGMEKTIYRFNIGAMTVEPMKKYLTLGGLLIVGDRDEAHTLALSSGVGVLITGGFAASDKNKALADRLKLPIISTSYDTFTTASLINRAISENLIKQTIPYVRDILYKEPVALKEWDRVRDYKKQSEATGYDKFPVVNDQGQVVGVVTPREVLAVEDHVRLKGILKETLLHVTPKTTISYAAHIMDWENIPLCPVVEEGQLVGVITRTDLLKTLQERHMKPMQTDTIEDRLLRSLKFEKQGERHLYHGAVTPEFLDPFGNASRGVISMLMGKAAMSVLQRMHVSCSIDNLSTEFYELLGMEARFTLEVEVVKSTKSYSKTNIHMTSGEKRIATARLNVLHTLDH